jgi:hypothetical protein
MLYRLPSIAAAAIIVATFTAHSLGAQPAAEKVLHRKPLSDGRELVVVLEPMVPASALKGLFTSPATDKLLGLTTLNLVLHSPSNPPLRLWCRKCPLYFEREDEQFQVLDLVVKPDLIVMAMVGPGSQIFVVKVGLFQRGPDAIETLRGADWSLLAAAIPTRPGRLSAKISFDETGKQVGVEVTDFLQDTKQRTVFAQKAGEWQFVRVKQWQEKVPATQPAAVPGGGRK